MRDPARGAPRSSPSAAARAPARRCSGFASSGLPGPKGNRETFVWLAEGERRGARASDSRRAGVEP